MSTLSVKACEWVKPAYMLQSWASVLLLGMLVQEFLPFALLANVKLWEHSL